MWKNVNIWNLGKGSSEIPCLFLSSGGSDGKESACNVEDPGSIPGSGRSPGEETGNSLKYSCLENPMDRGAWQAIYSPWGRKESNTTEQLTHTWLSFSHSVVSDSATTWTAACQASLPFTISSSLFKLKSIEWAMPSNHPLSVVPFSSCLQSFPASGSFPVSQFFTSGGQSIRVSTSFQ